MTEFAKATRSLGKKLGQPKGSLGHPRPDFNKNSSGQWIRYGCNISQMKVCFPTQ